MEIIPTTVVGQQLQQLGDFIGANGVAIVALFFVMVALSFVMAWFDQVKQDKYLDSMIKLTSKRL